MKEFILGVTSSLAASALLVIGARLLPQSWRTALMWAAARVLNCGITASFRDEGRAASAILAEARKSETIRILSIRGFRLTSEDRPLSVLLHPENAYRQLEIMIADPRSAAVSQRDAGFATRAVTYGKGSYHEDVNRSLIALAHARRRNSRISIRTHFQCESFRLIILDSSLFLSFYPLGVSASESPVYRVARDSWLYRALLSHYQWIRTELSQPYQDSY